MQEIAPGLHRWTAWHPHWEEQVADRGPSEVVFWLPRQRALAAGDVLLGSPLRLCPQSWLGRSSHADLRASLRPLLDLPVVRMLVSHGEPVLHGGRRALAALLSA